jgi:hypothetical protein
MAFVPELAPGERLIFEEKLDLGGSKSAVAFAFSAQAAYFPARKMFAMSDPRYYHRIPRSEILEVGLSRNPSPWFWLSWPLAAYVWAHVISQALGDELVVWSVGGIITVLAGVLVFIRSAGRRSVFVKTVHRRYTWSPPSQLGRKALAEVDEYERRLLRAFEEAGVPVRGERPS